MKIRWTSQSVRFRITPEELESLCHGQTVIDTLTLGREGWTAVLSCGLEHRSPIIAHGILTVILSSADVAKLLEPTAEGIYFTSVECGTRYQIEKDFPCVHPRGGELLEPATATFAPPTDFESRKI